MPTPLYCLRLPQKVQDDILTLSRMYGLPNGRAFAREILETITSGDMERIQAFNRRLMMGLGEQLALKLNEPLRALSEQQERKPKPKGGRRGRRKRG